MRQLWIIWGSLFVCFNAQAQYRLCNPDKEICPGYGSRRSATQANPSRSSAVNLNPSSVSVEKGYGLEAIAYKGSADFSIVRGTGRVGAAFSPTVGEETFFGPLGFELDPDYLARKIRKDKYGSQKVTLATAMVLVDAGSGKNRLQLNLGAIAKYNRLTQSWWGGGGLTGSAGPMTFGYAVVNDEYMIDLTSSGLSTGLKFRYSTVAASGGIHLGNFIADYTTMWVRYQEQTIATIRLLTGSFMWNGVILTLSQKQEDSARSAYDDSTQSLIPQQIKTEYFGGLQLMLSKNFMVSGYYNYYLLKEVSMGVTVFL